MPGANYPAGDWLPTKLNDLEQRLRALETQQSFVITDASGRIRTRLGLLGNGDYGLQLVDVLGNSEEVLPTVYSQAPGAITTTSTSLTYVSGAPSVEVQVGASGRALVWIGAGINAPSGDTAVMSVFAGGSVPTGMNRILWSFVQQGTTYSASVVSGLTPGAVTFEIVIATGGGISGGAWENMALIVRPL